MKTAISQNPVRRQIVVSLVIILVTAIILGFLFTKKTDTAKPVPANHIPAVSVITVNTEKISIPLQARGIVEPEKQIGLVSQVIGTVTTISEKFAVGSSFRKGDILLQADTTYLNMELQKASAAYQQALFHELEVKAQIEAGSAIENSTTGNDLAQGKPQLAVATSAVKAALAAMQVAQKQMVNATLRAPFNGRVMARNIQEQEQLVIGRPLAQIYSTDSYRIRFPLTQEQSALLAISPDDNHAERPLLISHETTGQQWQGKILHSEGFIAPNRMIYIIAEVLPGKSTLNEIVPGSLLKIDIPGKLMDNVITLPVQALHENDTVWTITGDNRLQIKPVTLLHRRGDKAYITNGLEDGDRVVLGQITDAYENRLVKPLDANSEKTETIKDYPR